MIRAEKSQKEARSRQVALSRKYRSGELPDIQICVREIVEPLQALVLLDIRLAKSVFVGLVSSAGAASNSPSLEMFKSELYSSIYSIFQITVMFYTPFIGCLLEILLEAPTISCASDLLLRVVKHSGNFHLGALVLEKMLSPAHSPLHNRNRSTVASSESTLVITSVSESDLRAWEDLCSVYQMLDRPDISQSIIEKVGLFGEGYAKALSREANEDYDAALKLYEEASGHHKSLFAKRRILHCQHQLGLWDEMKDIFTSAVVGEMWDNDVYREEFLPVFMEQSVKLTTSPSSLFNGFLLSSSKMDAKQTFLEQKYAPFLALYHASHSDPSFARSFVKKSFEGVLDAFSATHPLCDEARLSLISSLQMVNEIDEFLEASSRAILAGEGDDACEQVYKDHLIQHWMNRFPSSSNTALTVWDNVICARNILLTKVVSSVAVESLELVNRKRIANAARMHAQFAVGSRWLKPLWESSKAETIYPVSKILIAKLDMAEDATDIAARCGDVMGTFKVTLRKVEDALSHSKMIKFQIMNAEFSSLMLAKLVRSSDALWKCLNQSKFIVKQAHDIESNDGYIEFFSNRGFQALTRATAMLQSSNEIAQAGKVRKY